MGIISENGFGATCCELLKMVISTFYANFSVMKLKPFRGKAWQYCKKFCLFREGLSRKSFSAFF